MKNRRNWIVLTLTSLAGIIGASYYYLIRRPLPPKKGFIYADGIRNPVEIIRDKWGIPHIYAHDEIDLFFGQGYVHAQDRLWQMEFSRRLASGRTAEILGEASLQLDRWMRTLSLRWVAEQEAALLDSNVKKLLEAYAEGVNARIRESRLPIEFTLLRFKPERWTVVDSLCWAKMMAWHLSVNWESELIRSQIIEAIGPENAALLEPDLARNYPSVLPQGTDYSYIGVESLSRLQNAREMSGLGSSEGLGSNNWVVSGSKTVTGKPLLANDMHLGMSIPSIWYENHLVGGSFNLSGITFPGIPGIVSGHNGHVAWGYTNGFPDVQDLFIEHTKTDESGQTFYEYKGEWKKADIRYEKIHIKGKQPVIEAVVSTHHGPIINSLAKKLTGEHPLALRWTALEPGEMLIGLLRMLSSRNCGEFKEALRKWDVPSQNTVYADIDGNIYYSLTGKIPIRNNGDGRVPVPGWTGEYEWCGYIPFDDLPHLINPDQGYILSANNRVAQEDYPYWLGYDHCTGNRAQRIHELLSEREIFDMDYMIRMQIDQVSVAARRITRSIVALGINDPDLEPILTRLTSWNNEIALHSPEAAIYEVFIRFFLAELLNDTLHDLAGNYMGKGPTPVISEGSIMGQRSREWIQTILEDPTPYKNLKPDLTGSLKELVTVTLKRTANYLEENLGPDIQNWSWGKIHSLTFNHVLGSLKPLNTLFNRGPYPIGGDSDTLWNTSSSFSDTTSQYITSAPFRFIADLSNLDNSIGCLVPGQSGQPSSKHYTDQIQDWFKGKYHPMLYSRGSVEKHRHTTFWLEPKAK